MVRRTIAIRDGRTATETLRHGVADDSGTLGHAVEYAVLDRAGRLQLPREMTEALNMRDRVRLESEVDHIGVWPDTRRPANPGRPADAGTAAGSDAGAGTSGNTGTGTEEGEQ